MNARAGGRRVRVAGGVIRGLRRVAADASPLLQGTVAATVAWVIGKQVNDVHEPFFAPIAAVVALNAPLGERGLNALRLLLGVIVGIVAGELTVATLGSGYGQLALAVLVATAAARAFGGARIVTAQAAAAAILTVATAQGESGIHRLLDALIGGGVTLVFTQILFSPEPVALVRRAEAAALRKMASGLELTARALESDDDALADRAMGTLRDLRDRLGELARLRRVSTRVARHSLLWRSRITPVVRENENAGHLDLLGGSCVLVARTVMAASPAERGTLAPPVRELSAALEDLARDPGDRATRQAAVDRGVDVARRLKGRANPPESTLAPAVMALGMVTVDLMVFAGVEPDQALAAVRQGIGELRISAPSVTRPKGSGWKGWLLRRGHTSLR